MRIHDNPISPMQILLEKYPGDEWSADFLEMKKKNIKSDANFWRDLVTAELTAFPKINNKSLTSEAEYQTYFENFWNEIRPRILKSVRGLTEASKAGCEVYIKKWLARLPDDEKKLLLNFKNQFSNTALHEACKVGQLEIVKILVEAGADINANGSDGISLHYAIQYPEILDYLLSKKADYKLKNSRGRQAIHEAAIGYSAQAIRTLVNYDKTQLTYLDSNNQWTPFYHAAIARNEDAMTVLKELRVDVNEMTPMVKQTVLHLAVKENAPDLIKFLIEELGAKVDVLDKNGYTPLQYAATLIEPPIEAAKALIDLGANVNVENEAENLLPPIYILAQENDPDSEAVQAFAHLLKDHHAHPDAKHGENPYVILGLERQTQTI